MAFLPKTQMELDFTANTDIAETHIKSATTQPSAADVTRLDDRHFALHWTQAAPVRLEIELLASGARLTSTPTSVSIGLKTDQPPRATLAFSGVHNRITPAATIPLTTDARDDYGVAQVGLAIGTEVSNPDDPSQFAHHDSAVPLYGPVIPATETEMQLPYSLAVSPMKLVPGESALRACDRDGSLFYRAADERIPRCDVPHCFGGGIVQGDFASPAIGACEIPPAGR